MSVGLGFNKFGSDLILDAEPIDFWAKLGYSIHLIGSRIHSRRHQAQFGLPMAVVRESPEGLEAGEGVEEVAHGREDGEVAAAAEAEFILEELVEEDEEDAETKVSDIG